MPHPQHSVRLPLRLVPEADESLVGFLIRLTERNRFDSPRWLMDLAGIRFQAIEVAATKPFDLSSLSAVCAVDAETLARMTYWPVGRGGGLRFLANTIGKEIVYLRRRRACPRCLEQFTYHRAAWDLSVVTACPTHAALLADRCLRCRRALSWTAPSLTRCRCGADLRRQPIFDVDQKQLTGTRHVFELLGLGSFSEAPQRLEALQGLDAGETLTLFLHLGWCAEGGLPPARPSRLCHEGLEVHRMINTGYLACQDWPESFFRFMGTAEGVAHAGCPPGSPYRAALPDRILYPGLPARLRALLGPAVRRYMRPTQPAPFMSKSRSEPCDPGYLTLPTVARVLERSRSRLHRVLSTNGLLETQDDLGRATSLVVRKQLVESLQDAIAGLIGPSDLVRLLGCSEKMTAAILRAGYLQRAKGVDAELFGAPAWRRSEVEQFLSDLERCTSVNSCSATLVPLTAAFQTLRRRGVDATEAIEALRGGRFAATALDYSGVGLARILVDRATCLRVGQRVQDPHFISIAVFAQCCNLRLQVAYQLTSSGSVKTVKLPRQRGRWVALSEVTRFRMSQKKLGKRMASFAAGRGRVEDTQIKVRLRGHQRGPRPSATESGERA